MQNKYFKFLLIALIVAFIVPQITLAAWYNPFSWNWNILSWFNPSVKNQTQPMVGNDKDAHGCIGSAGYTWCAVKNKCLRVWEEKCEATATGITADSLESATLSYPNPYDNSKTDTFTLVNGKSALLYDSGNINPRGYTVAATAVGDLNGDGVADGAMGIYQGWGANRITPIVFVVSNKNGVLTEIDSVLPDSSSWNDETAIKSLSINNGILSVNLLMLSDADKNLPHYQQTPTVTKTVQYKLINGKLILQPAAQTADWKTYTDSKLNISFEYPTNWSVVPTVKDDTNYDGDVLTPPNVPNNYNIINISQVDCDWIIRQHPGKIATCKQMGDSNMSVYDAMNTDDNNSRTDTIIDEIISTFKFTPK